MSIATILPRSPTRPRRIMTSGRQVGSDMVALGIGVALMGIGVAALLAQGSRRSMGAAVRRLSQPNATERAVARRDASPTVIAARRLNRAAGTLAFSVLADSAVEHYRGSFFNSAMYTLLVVRWLSPSALMG
jgi:hypothetical protein